jgi:dTDP-L-rhamnose 4-epimerase
LAETVLIIGGAGFIGAHLARELLRVGYRVRILDNLDPQIHTDGQRPSYLDPDAELIVGDLRDREKLRPALAGIDLVCHLAAAVGVGQSMYQIEHYTSVNDLGTAILLEELAERPQVRRLLVASSMSIYGEGLARTTGEAGERAVEPEERPLEQLKAGHWELRLSNGQLLEPMPTPENKRPSLSSIYALNKYNQERMGLIFGRAYDREVVALRFFNVYGPHQALSNPLYGRSGHLRLAPPQQPAPYGVRRRQPAAGLRPCHRCGARLPPGAGNAGRRRPGHQRRLRREPHDHRGRPGACRRHGQAPAHAARHRKVPGRRYPPLLRDIGLARRVLGFEPRTRFEDGIAELAEWLSGEIAIDAVDKATEELSKRGLVA